MDIPREQHKGRRLVRRILVGLLLAGVIATVTVALSRLEPAAPSVEREMLLMDTVQRGNMILQVRGVGKLMSEDMLIVPATVAGRVKRILLEPGTPVEPNTVILELTNPNLQLAWLDAQSQLSSAQANLKSQEASLQDRLLGMESTLARARANSKDAKLQAEVDQKQFDDGLISTLRMAQSESRVAQQEILLEIEQKRYEVFRTQSLPAQLAAAEATVKQAESRYDLSKNEVASLQVRAGVAGVLAPVKSNLAAPVPEERTARDDAKTFLEDILVDGELPAKEVLAEARECGIAEKTLRRASGDIGVDIAHVGERGQKGGGKWVWRLPTEQHGQDTPCEKSGHLNNSRC